MRVLLATESLNLPDEPKYFALALYLLRRAVRDTPELADVEIDILECSVLDDSYPARLLEKSYDLVGFSNQCWNLDHHVALAERIKEAYPETLIVFGGHSAYNQIHELFARSPAIDFIANGEGESAFVSLLKALKDGSSLRGLPGICSRQHPHSPMAPVLRQPPLPFQEPSTPLSEYYLLESMRGCIYECHYCTWWVGQRRVRYFPAEYIEASLQHALDSGYRKVWLIDAAINFANGPLNRLAESVRRVDPEKLLKFWYFVQWAHFKPAQMPAFEALGVETIHIGLESANPEVLALAGRTWDEAKVRECVSQLSTIATPVVDIVLGLPGDTPDGFRRTLDFVESLDVNVIAFRLMVHPGSEHFRQREQLGLKIRQGRMPFVRETPTFSAQDFEELTEEVKQRAYFNPENKRHFLYEPPDYWEGGTPMVFAARK